MVKDFDNGTITIAEVETKVKIFKETHKRSKLILDAMIACGRPDLIENRLHQLNVLSKGEFVQLPDDVEIEMVLCPDQSDKGISRASCLSYSGSNTDKCQSCTHFKITRTLLLGRKDD